MRRPHFNRGRWAVERERHQLVEYASPVADQPPELLSGVIPGLLRKFRIGEDLWLRELEASWGEAVGPVVGPHTRPGRYERGQLTIFVDSSVWLNELKRYAQKELLQKLQRRFGAAQIASLRLQVDPDRGGYSGPSNTRRGQPQG